MHLIITEDYASLSQAAADWVVQAVAAKPAAVAVFPTGNSPLGLYKVLAERQRQGQFDPAQLHIFLLDEYLGLGPDAPRSLYRWLDKAFLTPLGIRAEQTTPLPATANDLDAAARAFDAAITAAGGLDFAVLGLGPNGHLGYNDPPAAGDAPTRVLTLAEESIATAAQYFDGADQVPRQAMTMGMAPLLAARQILLIVSGAHKRTILQQALRGPITPAVPASYLQQTANVTIIADRAAWPEAE